MRNIQLTIPVKIKGSSMTIGFYNKQFYLANRGNVYYFIINPKVILLLFTMVSMLGVFTILSSGNEVVYLDPSPNMPKNISTQNDNVDHLFLNVINNNNKSAVSATTSNSVREEFLVEKQLLVTKFLIDSKVNRVDQLEINKLLDLNHQISELFIAKVLNNIEIENHVYDFLTSEVPLKKIETALMEQAKFHIPTSITIGQAALETGYGKRVINNNYFGIKDKSKKVTPITTTEYYNEKEFKYNKNIIVSYEKIKKGGKVTYKCTVRDSFQSYKTPWESFRAHSKFLSNNNRYAPLFTKGRDYTAWADKIGSTKYGGVGYATSPIYGQVLKKVIKRYHLDLLDF